MVPTTVRPAPQNQPQRPNSEPAPLILNPLSVDLTPRLLLSSGTVKLWSVVDGLAKKEKPYLLKTYVHPLSVEDVTPLPTWRGWGKEPANYRRPRTPRCPSPVRRMTKEEREDLVEEFQELFPKKEREELAEAVVPPSSGDWIKAVMFHSPREALVDDVLMAHYTEMVSASWDNTIRVWDIQAARCNETLIGHTDGVKCLAAQGERIISGSYDRTVRVWYRGGCELVLMGHNDVILSVAASFDRVVSGAWDGVFKVRVRVRVKIRIRSRVRIRVRVKVRIRVSS